MKALWVQLEREGWILATICWQDWRDLGTAQLEDLERVEPAALGRLGDSRKSLAVIWEVNSSPHDLQRSYRMLHGDGQP